MSSAARIGRENHRSHRKAASSRDGNIAGSSTSCCHEKTAAQPWLRVPVRRPGARWQHSVAALGAALRFIGADDEAIGGRGGIGSDCPVSRAEFPA